MIRLLASPLPACLVAALALCGRLDGPATPPPAPAGEEQDAGGETPLERQRRLREEEDRARAEARAEVLAALVPGALPDGTQEEARRLWRELCDASLADVPVRAFDVSFHMRVRRPDAGSNDVALHYRYLEPDYVRATIAESKRELLRGPDGDWLLDGQTGEELRLVGRGAVQDRRQLDEMLGVARNFVGLSNPAGLRIVRLERLAGPPATVPTSRMERAQQLDWLSVASPDFRLQSGAAPPGTVFRADFGIDRERRDLRLVVLGEEGAGARLLPTTLLVEMDQHRTVDGFRVPAHIRLFAVDVEARPPVFRDRAYTELWWIRGRLRAELAPQDFLP